MAAQVPTDSECIFCKIVAGEIPSPRIAESENVIAIHDINPAAPLHALVIPKGHYQTVAEVAKVNPAQVGEIVELADLVANQEADGAYRLIINSGATAGQSVFHAHGHVIAGKTLGWNPA